MRTFAILLVTVLLFAPAMPQTPTAPNSVYLEALGPGLLYSCNYDRLLSESFGVRAGLSYFAPEMTSLITVPLSAQYLIGSGSSKLELGLGISVLFVPEHTALSFMSAPKEKLRGNSILATVTIGYRYQPADGGFLFRAGFTPFFGKFAKDVSPSIYVDVYEDVYRVRPWGGLSLGYAF